MARTPAKRRPPPPSPSAAIADWLNLVEPDGAFLTPGVLKEVFPHGFDPLDAEVRIQVKAKVYEADDDGNASDRVALREWLLREVLEWGDQLADGQQIASALRVTIAEHNVSILPDYALVDTDDPSRTRLGVFTWIRGSSLDRKPEMAVSGDTWSASPLQRAEKWCREANVPLALVTDDDQWVLVWAPRNASSASCRFRTSDVADERVLQAALVSLLSARRFFAVSDDPATGETIERLFERAADAEVEITKGLGRQVRHSVELMVASISRAHVASNEQLLASVSNHELYEAAVGVLMRLVFLLYAEERRLLPSEDPLWAESYSVLTLREQLRQASHRDGLDTLERRSTAWYRLLATFRAVHGGVQHDRLRLPAYGGALFDPDRFPVLEGRHQSGDDRPVPIDDRTVLAVLDALLTVEVGRGNRKVAQRLSYKALDVEQIGHCYEGLLDHGCANVDVLSVGLVGPEANEPEVTVDELEHRLAGGTDALCAWLADKEHCDKSVKELQRLVALQPDGAQLAQLRSACGLDDAATERARPFWGLLRTDLRGLPLVLMPGAKYVTQTSTRRNTGAQYTTKELAEEVVKYALEPLVYAPGPAEEADATKWNINTPQQILDLRVCDLAVGSGAILTAACRFLADCLIDAVTEHGVGVGDGALQARLTDLADAPADDQLMMARREIVDHCLYGVDKNPVAAEMAKLSLWLTTMARERPFTFLDHAIQVGDSLLGITSVEQLRWLHLDPAARKGKAGFEILTIEDRVDDAVQLAEQLQAMSVVTVRDATEKQRLHEQLRAALADLSVVADTVVGAALSTSAKSAGIDFESQIGSEASRIRSLLDSTRTDGEREATRIALADHARYWLRSDLPDEPPAPWDRKCMHWPLRFPEVFLTESRTGFDAIVANPPFLGGKRISGANGSAYREHLVRWIADGVTGNADLVAYFLLRMCALAGSIGTLATNTISQGDTREVALDRLLADGWTVHRAVKSEPWPNEATLEIAKLWLHAGLWIGARELSGRQAKEITSALNLARSVEGLPRKLVANKNLSFIGLLLNGIGFVLSEDEAADLIAQDDRNRHVLSPYLNGSDLNESPSQRARRWAINFSDWDEEKARSYADCFRIVEERVKPTRLRLPDYKAKLRTSWWQYEFQGTAMRAATASLARVLAIGRVSKTVAPVFIDPAQIPSEQCVLFAYDDDAHFGLLSSVFHWWWAVTYASTMRADLRYTPSDVFETFPQPMSQSGSLWRAIEEAGRELNEHRSQLMVDTQLGLTKTYNRAHNPVEHDPAIERLRELHVALDRAVRDAYGWHDLALDHHHWETPQGMRFTVSQEAKEELLDRLLELNHQRYAGEVAAGLHDKKKPTTKRRTASTSGNQESML